MLGLLVSVAMLAQLNPDTLPLMPKPVDVSFTAGSLPIDAGFSVSLEGSGSKDARLRGAVERFLAQLSLETGVPIERREASANGKLRVIVEQRNGTAEDYRIEIANGAARLSATGPLGAMDGLETLLQLATQNTGDGVPGFSFPNTTIRDQPRFAWRGLSLDVSRHFIPTQDVERTLDAMAAVKMNVLHWHLSDDQGFRVESRKYPRLQQYGSDGMYYTQGEIRAVVAYAHDRGIRVVPELDMPGHAMSWLVGYPKLGSRSGQFQLVRQSGVLADLIDPTQEYTYRFIDGLVGEMAKLFPDEYFHIGGDEVAPKEWLDNARIRKFMQKHSLSTPAQLQAYFNTRLVKILAKHHKKMIGWDEVLQPDLPKSVVIQSWRGQESLWTAAQEGHQAILSAGYYLDLMYPAGYHYSVDPFKAPPAAPGGQTPAMPAIALTPEIESRILGGEAAMWEELANAEDLDEKLWPRLAAIAERFWSPEAVTDTVSMYQRLELVDHWLEWLGTNQYSNVERMRARLVGEHATAQLDLFASILEPVKGYKRHAEHYNIFTPLNRLVDAVPPESAAARHFRDEVDVYLAGPHNDTAKLRRELMMWWENAAAIRPTLEANSLLHEQLVVDDAVSAICQAGLDALALLEKNSPPAANWKENAAATVDKNKAPGADLLVQIAPGVAKLIAAAPSTSGSPSATGTPGGGY